MLVETIGRISAQDLHRAALKDRGKIDRLFLHWTAGHYNQVYSDYHVNISHEGNVFLTYESLADNKCHTKFHNSRAVGIAMDCAAGAVLNKALFPGKVNFGKEPPTLVQIETLAKVIAILTDALDLEILASTVTTHAEIANQDGYGPTNHAQADGDWRWDLWFLPCVERSNTKFVMGGKYIRDKARWYREHYFRNLFK